MNQKAHPSYFSKADMILYFSSIALILGAFIAFDRTHYFNLSASLIGATSLILNAKGNPVGQALMVLFSVLYGLISLSYAYYGEVATYMGLTAPMALCALLSWLRHPYRGKRNEVEVNRLCTRDYILMCILSLGITAIFYWILRALHTQNLMLSTLSVTTSFAAVYLTARRSPYFAIAYAANDVILILLWSLASGKDPAYVSVLVCFVVFLANDIYGFVSWRRMLHRQSEGKVESGKWKVEI